MKKIDIGELVNNSYDINDTIDILSTQLETIYLGMAKALTTQNIAELGAAVGEMSQTIMIIKGLNEKVNGKKPPTVL